MRIGKIIIKEEKLDKLYLRVKYHRNRLRTNKTKNYLKNRLNCFRKNKLLYKMKKLSLIKYQNNLTEIKIKLFQNTKKKKKYLLTLETMKICGIQITLSSETKKKKYLTLIKMKDKKSETHSKPLKLYCNKDKKNSTRFLSKKNQETLTRHYSMGTESNGTKIKISGWKPLTEYSLQPQLSKDSEKFQTNTEAVQLTSQVQSKCQWLSIYYTIWPTCVFSKTFTCRESA